MASGGQGWDALGYKGRGQSEQSHGQRDLCCRNGNWVSGVKAVGGGAGSGEGEWVTE